VRPSLADRVVQDLHAKKESPMSKLLRFLLFTSVLSVTGCGGCKGCGTSSSRPTIITEQMQQKPTDKDLQK
jgi:hypothetical protein